MRLKDKIAIVTGAASGIGRAVALIFAQEGAKVVVADVLDGEGQATVAEITLAGGTALYRHLDVTNDDGWHATTSATREIFGPVNVLVNNAGLSGTSYANAFDEEGWHRLMGVNARGAFLGMKHLVTPMCAIGGGSIVNVSSISALIGQQNVHVAYNASKAALHLMTKSIAVQFGGAGVRCNSVHPGMLPPMRTSVSSAEPAFRERLLQRIPLGRAGNVEEVAHAVLFLASDEASYITGTELLVDGGYLAN